MLVKSAALPNESCSICLSKDFTHENPPMKHEGNGLNHGPIHRLCWKEWLVSKPNCPHCRIDVDLYSLLSKRDRFVSKIKQVVCSTLFHMYHVSNHIGTPDLLLRFKENVWGAPQLGSCLLAAACGAVASRMIVNPSAKMIAFGMGCIGSMIWIYGEDMNDEDNKSMLSPIFLSGVVGFLQEECWDRVRTMMDFRAFQTDINSVAAALTFTATLNYMGLSGSNSRDAGTLFAGVVAATRSLFGR